MKLLTFKGGVHPQYNKEYSEKKAIEKVESPKVCIYTSSTTYRCASKGNC